MRWTQLCNITGMRSVKKVKKATPVKDYLRQIKGTEAAMNERMNEQTNT